MHGLLDGFIEILLGSGMFTGIIALLAGVLTSLTPCGLAGVPLILGVINESEGEGKNTVKAFAMSLFFAAGAAAVYLTIGLVALFTGKFIEDSALSHIILGM